MNIQKIISFLNLCILLILFGCSCWFIYDTFAPGENIPPAFCEDDTLKINAHQESEQQNTVVIGQQTEQMETIESMKNKTPLFSLLFEGSGYTPELEFCSDYSEIAEKISIGKIDIGKMTPLAFIENQKKYNLEILVLREPFKTKRTLFLVRNDSPIHTISDIKNTILGLKNNTSFSGYFLPLSFLRKQNISIKDLKRIEYSDDETNSLIGLIQGQYDVIAIKDSVYNDISENERSAVRVIAETVSDLASPFVISATLSEKRKQDIAQIFLKHSALMKNPEFAEAVKLSDSDWTIRDGSKSDKQQYVNMAQVLTEITQNKVLNDFNAPIFFRPIRIGLQSDNMETIQELNSDLPVYRMMFSGYSHPFELMYYSSYTEIAEKIAFHQIDTGSFSAAAYVENRLKYPLIPLLIKVSPDDVNYTLFLAKIDSSAASINDLKGKSITFKSRQSSSGYLLPVAYLNEKNISVSDFSQVMFSGDEISSYQQLIRGDTDIIVLKNSFYEKLSESEKNAVKIIGKTGESARGVFLISDSTSSVLKSELCEIFMKINSLTHTEEYKNADKDWILKIPDHDDFKKFDFLEKALENRL